MSRSGHAAGGKPKPAKKRQVAWLDDGVAAELDMVAEDLARRLGFKPTRSQTLLYILKRKSPEVTGNVATTEGLDDD